MRAKDFKSMAKTLTPIIIGIATFVACIFFDRWVINLALDPIHADLGSFFMIAKVAAWLFMLSATGALAFLISWIFGAIAAAFLW